MFGWVGKLFGTDKAASSLIENISSGLDKLHYSDQEKSEDLARSVTEGRQVLLDWLKTTSGSSLARRLIALVVTGIWALQYVASMILLALVPWLPDFSDKMRESALSLQTSGDAVSGAMMLVLGFYFAAPHLGNIVEGAMSKFSGKGKQHVK
ncbi:putative TMhelix containing protein [Vibrio phage 496E54-1]|nr:putative TMhelix containing protein [Vibrio phage 495E54-1]CAH9014967.1 putative TMhelix containing protein [Vibrio phage 496E54-1]